MNHPLLEFLALVRDLCRFRRGPQDLPHAPVLLGLLIALGTFIDLVSGVLLGGIPHMLARSLVSTALVLGLCWIALALRHRLARYVQTATALVACGIAFSLAILLFAWLAGSPPATPAELTPLHVLLGWGMLTLIVWSVAVNAHILRHALDAPFMFGLALASTWTLADWALADWALGHALFDAAH